MRVRRYVRVRMCALQYTRNNAHKRHRTLGAGMETYMCTQVSAYPCFECVDSRPFCNTMCMLVCVFCLHFVCRFL